MLFTKYLSPIGLVLFCIASLPLSAQESPADRALNFLKVACVTGGSSSSVDIVTTEGGGLQFKDGKKTVITVSQKELQGLVEGSSAYNIQQASEVRKCMQPYIDKMVQAYLNPVVSGPSTQTIETGGIAFIADEYDVALLLLSERPYERWPHSDLVNRSKLAPFKMRHYIGIAIKNGMAEQFTGLTPGTIYTVCPCFSITDKGTAYLMSRGK